jgi:hypothetical protein
MGFSDECIVRKRVWLGRTWGVISLRYPTWFIGSNTPSFYVYDMCRSLDL